MYSSRPTQRYHFQADLNWCDGTFKGYLGSLQLDENVRERDVRLKRVASINFWPGVYSFRRFVAQPPQDNTGIFLENTLGYQRSGDFPYF